MEPIHHPESSLSTSNPIPHTQYPISHTFSQKQVAELLGCSVATLARKLKQWEINPHGRKLTLDQVKICYDRVGKPFDR